VSVQFAIGTIRGQIVIALSRVRAPGDLGVLFAPESEDHEIRVPIDAEIVRIVENMIDPSAG
jgi:hypothetical protein